MDACERGQRSQSGTSSEVPDSADATKPISSPTPPPSNSTTVAHLEKDLVLAAFDASSQSPTSARDRHLRSRILEVIADAFFSLASLNTPQSPAAVPETISLLEREESAFLERSDDDTCLAAAADAMAAGRPFGSGDAESLWQYWMNSSPDGNSSAASPPMPTPTRGSAPGAMCSWERYSLPWWLPRDQNESLVLSCRLYDDILRPLGADLKATNETQVLRDWHAFLRRKQGNCLNVLGVKLMELAAASADSSSSSGSGARVDSPRDRVAGRRQLAAQPVILFARPAGLLEREGPRKHGASELQPREADARGLSWRVSAEPARRNTDTPRAAAAQQGHQLLPCCTGELTLALCRLLGQHQSGARGSLSCLCGAGPRQRARAIQVRPKSDATAQVGVLSDTYVFDLLTKALHHYDTESKAAGRLRAEQLSDQRAQYAAQKIAEIQHRLGKLHSNALGAITGEASRKSTFKLASVHFNNALAMYDADEFER